MLHSATTHNNQFLYSSFPIVQIEVTFLYLLLLDSLWTSLIHVVCLWKSTLQISFCAHSDKLIFQTHVSFHLQNIQNSTIFSLDIALLDIQDHYSFLLCKIPHKIDKFDWENRNSQIQKVCPQWSLQHIRTDFGFYFLKFHNHLSDPLGILLSTLNLFLSIIHKTHTFYFWNILCRWPHQFVLSTVFHSLDLLVISTLDFQWSSSLFLSWTFPNNRVYHFKSNLHKAQYYLIQFIQSHV